MKPKNRSKYPDQKRLLALIYRKAGGLNATAKKLSVSPQLAFFWREQGYIPLKRLLIIAQILKVSPYTLNFRAYKAFTGESIEWKDVVKSCKLSKIEHKFVMG